MNKDLHRTLGVPRDATPQEIKAAYRREAAKHHPDKGGDTEEFLAVQLAYETLSDPRRRRRYEETGSTNRPRDAVASDAIRYVMAEVVAMDHRKIDVLSRARAAVERDIDACTARSTKAQQAAQEFHDAAARFGTSNGDNVLAGALQQQAIDAERSVALSLEDADRKREVLEFLRAYSYRVDEEPKVEEDASDGNPVSFQDVWTWALHNRKHT